eukprot:NODE_2321_length_1088_cov_60.755463_g2303_i0.p1 GENE.NODE_2321_length_1088_cov_60.755463_g2303_i0~~NODE_2321_length_1088_cov_60.755463_g2303_i0.p1  ORF type:complete len:314 (-),score=29.26 NODE_2321_length_1088_cov_60.755463_g2303_i0:52-993(-)
MKGVTGAWNTESMTEAIGALSGWAPEAMQEAIQSVHGKEPSERRIRRVEETPTVEHLRLNKEGEVVGRDFVDFNKLSPGLQSQLRGCSREQNAGSAEWKRGAYGGGDYSVGTHPFRQAPSRAAASPPPRSLASPRSMSPRAIEDAPTRFGGGAAWAPRSDSDRASGLCGGGLGARFDRLGRDDRVLDPGSHWLREERSRGSVTPFRDSWDAHLPHAGRDYRPESRALDSYATRDFGCGYKSDKVSELDERIAQIEARRQALRAEREATDYHRPQYEYDRSSPVFGWDRERPTDYRNDRGSALSRYASPCRGYR